MDGKICNLTLQITKKSVPVDTCVYVTSTNDVTKHQLILIARNDKRRQVIKSVWGGLNHIQCISEKCTGIFKFLPRNILKYLSI